MKELLVNYYKYDTFTVLLGHKINEIKWIRINHDHQAICLPNLVLSQKDHFRNKLAPGPGCQFGTSSSMVRVTSIAWEVVRQSLASLEVIEDDPLYHH